MSTYPTLNGLTLLDPGVLYPQALEQGLPLDFWGRANSYHCPRGKEAGSAFVLMTRATLNQLSQTAFVPLVFRSPQGSVTLSKLRFVRATCMSAGPTTTDVAAAYLVELADKRRWLAMSSINSQYNIRCPAPPAISTGVGGPPLAFHDESLDSGALWLWETMFEDVWSNLPSVLAGAAPPLPGVGQGEPSLPPEGFRFLGVSAWEAVHQILEHIGCTTVYDPATDAFSVVSMSTAQTGLTSAVSRLTDRKLDDLSPLEHTSAFLPESIRVLFHRTYKHYGSEPLTHRTGNWSQLPLYPELIPTQIAGAVPGTEVPLFDDMPAIQNASGTVLNSGDLALRALERASIYIDSATRRADHNHVIYGGAVTTISTGSEVERIIWRDYGDGIGMVTEIVNRPLARPSGLILPSAPSLHLAPPDLSRASFPVYPRDVHLVMVYQASGSDGSPVSPVGDGLFPGKVLRVDVDQDTETDAPYTEGEDCYLLSMNVESGSASSSPTLPKGERYLGRIVGTKLVGATPYPVYAVRKDEQSEGGGDLRMDWAQMQHGGVQSIAATGTTVIYTGGQTSADESVMDFDIATGKINVAEDGFVQIHFQANLTPDSAYGSFTDYWRLRLRNSPGSTQLVLYFPVDMNVTSFGTPIFAAWNVSLPNGTNAPIDLFMDLINLDSSVRNAQLENNTRFSVTWFNRPD